MSRKSVHYSACFRYVLQSVNFQALRVNRPSHECAPSLCGLGLTISSQICRYLNTDLSLESEEGQGTCVSLRICLNRDEVVHEDILQRSSELQERPNVHEGVENVEGLFTDRTMNSLGDLEEQEALQQPNGCAGLLPQPNRFNFIL